jgi:alkylation response protein AidB-like acyl-CoA dehydrogenase
MKQSGYLTCAVPRELGGGGLTFAEVMHEQRRLAYHAHATALGINMHHLLDRRGRRSVARGRQIARVAPTGAVKGEVYAAGHAERGNDIPVLMSTTKAERVDGGYRFTGAQVLRQPHARVDLPRHPRHRHERPGPSQ